MKLVCVNIKDVYYKWLRIGGVYDADITMSGRELSEEDFINYKNVYVSIKHDTNSYSYCPDNLFITLGKYREDKINKLLQ